MLSAMKGTPRAIQLLVLSFLCPTEFSLFLGTFRLPPHRLVLIVLLPLALHRIMTRRDIHWRTFDTAVLTSAIWAMYVFAHHLGNDAGIKYGGSLALESLGAFLIARAFVRDAETFRATCATLLAAVVCAGLIAMPETFLGKLYVHDTLAKLTGYVHPTGVEKRLGLTRAYGTFDHPIHYGTFAASVLAITWFTQTKATQQRVKAAIIAVITFLGLSSAPMLCLALQGGMIAWEKVTRTVTNRVTMLVGAIVALYFAASMVMTRSPFAFVATGFTLDPWTGYYRLQIWEHGLNNVGANPLMGIGLNDWARPEWMVSDTVDAFWLVLMMRQGLPALFLLLLSITLMIRAVNARGMAPQTHPGVRNYGKGWMMGLVALSLIACTVHYWNVLHSYFFFILGLGGWLADPGPQSLKVGTQVAGVRASAPIEVRAPPGTQPEPQPPGDGLSPPPHGPPPAQPPGLPVGGLAELGRTFVVALPPGHPARPS
ncbi:MAG: hypothetical protein AAFR04_09155 [Pseudomonadota bacterium]